MTQITGTSGRLTLKDSIVEFGNWRIYENIVGQNEPGPSDWNGSLEIKESDIGEVFPLVGGPQISAEFYGNENYSGEIAITGITDFIGTGKLKKTSRPQ